MYFNRLFFWSFTRPSIEQGTVWGSCKKWFWVRRPASDATRIPPPTALTPARALRRIYINVSAHLRPQSSVLKPNASVSFRHHEAHRKYLPTPPLLFWGHTNGFILIGFAKNFLIRKKESVWLSIICQKCLQRIFVFVGAKFECFNEIRSSEKKRLLRFLICKF